MAFVPIALGFQPERSVVMIAFGKRTSTFQARVDLPEWPEQVPAMVDALLRPALAHAASAVVLVLYADSSPLVDLTARTLTRGFRGSDVHVVEMLRVHAKRWFPMIAGDEGAGVEFETASHPFTAQAVVEGRVTRVSREALRATLDADPAAVAATARRLDDALPLAPEVLRELLRERVRAGTVLDESELARVATTIRHPPSRDQAWVWLDRDLARAAVDLWSDAVRRLPADHVAGPAAVLALAAWLCGDGALAWCAVDRARVEHPEHSLADLVAGLLESATPPAVWEEVRPVGGAGSAA